MVPPIPPSWRSHLDDQLDQPYFADLRDFVTEEQARHLVLPPEPEIFTALSLTPFDAVRVVIIGQDPYPTPGHAHGLAFSVRPGVKPPASLRNIFKELESDLGHPAPRNNGSLVAWAEQGVLLLNTVLTVRAGKPLSHRGKGWEVFTDAIIRKVGHRDRPAVFVLWGRHAQQKLPLIDTERHAVVKSGHPSPLAAKAGFFGSKPFSKTNAALRAVGQKPIDWQIRED